MVVKYKNVTHHNHAIKHILNLKEPVAEEKEIEEFDAFTKK